MSPGRNADRRKRPDQRSGLFLSVHFLSGFPTGINGFLMGDGIIADRLCPGHGKREVHAQMSLEIVGGDVLRAMRGIVGRTDIGFAVGEGDPDNLGSPGGLAAEGFQHDGSILGCNRFSIHVLIFCHDAKTPGITSAEIINGHIFTVAVIVAPVIETGVNHFSGAGG